MPETIVSLQHVDKWFGNNHVVKDMNLEIYKGEFLTLLGPSGCGKTTTLRMIAGFEDATGGVIEVEGDMLFAPVRFLSMNRCEVNSGEEHLAELIQMLQKLLLY